MKIIICMVASGIMNYAVMVHRLEKFSDHQMQNPITFIISTILFGICFYVSYKIMSGEWK